LSNLKKDMLKSLETDTDEGASSNARCSRPNARPDQNTSSSNTQGARPIRSSQQSTNAQANTQGHRPKPSAETKITEAQQQLQSKLNNIPLDPNNTISVRLNTAVNNLIRVKLNSIKDNCGSVSEDKQQYLRSEEFKQTIDELNDYELNPSSKACSKASSVVAY
jgi:hypothetical protein